MKKTTNIPGRFKAVLCALCLLILALVTVLLWRAGRSKQTAEATPPPTDAPSAEPSPSPIPPDMFEWREGEYVHVEYGPSESNTIDAGCLKDPETKNAADLVAWVQMAWENQWGYVWGTFGDVLTEDLLQFKLDQYGEDVEEYEPIIREKWMGRRVVDCAGLIKSYGWYDPDEGVISYGYGDMRDMGTDGFYDAAPDKGPIDTMPDKPGLLVYSTKGHIGVYIGDGWAIEAISHAGGVVKTRVADRPWTHWLQCPYIQY